MSLSKESSINKSKLSRIEREKKLKNEPKPRVKRKTF